MFSKHHSTTEETDNSTLDCAVPRDGLMGFGEVLSATTALQPQHKMNVPRTVQ